MDMNKKLLVSFLAFVSVLFLAVTVSAADVVSGGPTAIDVEVDGIDWDNDPAIIVGDTLSVRVEFTSDVNAQDITVEVEIEGDRKDVEVQTRLFDVEANNSYVKTLRLEVPFDLKDELSDVVTLNVDISGSGFKTTAFRELRVQRESFNADIKSIGVPQTVKAGETFPVDIVLKNLGYNDLDDLFVTARISALDIERTVFLGDLVALDCDDDAESVDNYGIDITRKCNEDDDDTVFGRIFLTVPFDAESGVYALEVEVENEDTTSSEVVQIVIGNAFSAGNFIVSGNQLLIVNPTNDVVVYRLVPESTSTVSVSLSESLVAVSAGSSETITVEATSKSLVCTSTSFLSPSISTSTVMS